MEVIVEARSIAKKFGDVVAVRDVSFTVARGEVFCLVGPNGAGKTTTFRIVAGLIRPDKGFVSVLGEDPYAMDPRVRRKITYLPEDAGVYRNLTGLEYLEVVAGVYASSREESRRFLERGIQLSGLGEELRRRAGGYSRGMKRRLALAAALMVEPELAILDEPTAGLDVSHSLAVRNTIKSYVRESGSSALVSSHNMLEVEYLCDRVAIISRGVIVAEGAPGELKDEYGASNLEEVYIKIVGGGA